MVKPFLIGTSDYKKIIDSNGFYVDKTLLIKEIAQVPAEVFLFPRPRRFGKTLNMSMLQYFYERPVTNAAGEASKSNQYLFESMAIWKEEVYRKEQGQWPVISVSLKDTKKATWDGAYAALQNIISSEFKRHRDLLSSKSMDPQDKKIFQAIMDKTAHESDYSSSFKFLCKLLADLYDKPVIMLIDEYDAPIHAAYQYGYYNKMINFMRELLSGVLKDNKYLKFGVLTGILRVAKESIFSGLNNLKVYTMFDAKFADKFGLTQQEIDDALEVYGLSDHRSELQRWYNGYQSGATKVYNPWSVANCLQEHGTFRNYWLNTSDNALVKQEIAACSEEVFAALESLLENKQVEQVIDDGITMPHLQLETAHDIAKKEHAVWSLLFYTGYVTYNSYEYKQGKYVCSLTIPNLEVRDLYRDLITEAVAQVAPGSATAELKVALMQGNGSKFGQLLQQFILRSMSSHDLYFNECERNAHLFMLGILVIFEQEYAVRSNRESGYGRYDIMLLPKIKGYAGWVIELKKVDEGTKETLETTVNIALDQIKEKEYATELRAHNVHNIVAVGVAVHGKKLLVKHEVL